MLELTSSHVCHSAHYDISSRAADVDLSAYEIKGCLTVSSEHFTW